MLVNNIELSWFRGAGSCFDLKAKRKSVVIYGANGAGKSTIADAFEYIAANGKVGHLAHEYSGYKQRNGLRNTHAPEDTSSQVKITFQDNYFLNATISPKGTLSIVCEPSDLVRTIQSWDIERFILRQDEVANFIHATKGEKYSVLLPLLGLERYEQIAINLNKLIKVLEKRSNLNSKKQKLNDIEHEALRQLPDISPSTLEDTLSKLSDTYLSEQPPNTFDELLNIVEEEIDSHIGKLEPEQRRCILVQQISKEKLRVKLDNLIAVEHQASGILGELINRRIAVLETSREFINAVDIKPKVIECPACSRDIPLIEFEKHVSTELGTLKQARAVRDQKINTRKRLTESIDRVRRIVIEREFSNWLDQPEQSTLNRALSNILRLDLKDCESVWDSSTWDSLKNHIPKVVREIDNALNTSPPSIQQLMTDKQIVSACRLIPEIAALKNEITSIDKIGNHLGRAESSIREYLKIRSRKVMENVSNEIHYLWSKLHPDEPIEEIRLYIPKDADKAIDICLKFFGVDQPSPRLTLSEGHRNSLGLCIFLAIVKMEENQDHPIILDDVISSLDREHRGMLTNVLVEDFANRQLFIFTHDREWYTELRWRLPAKEWIHVALRPWENPDMGIQWASSQDTFDDARILVKENPEAAGNRVRAIMDANLAIIAERLRIPVPYARGDRNDHRTCVEFIERIISNAKKNLRKKDGNQWVIYQKPITHWEEAHSLLIPWANRASHTGSLTGNEVHQLIQVCDDSLTHFRCTKCNDPIWIAEQKSRSRMQCSCGDLQWRYG